jgi:hypothetical protein
MKAKALVNSVLGIFAEIIYALAITLVAFLSCFILLTIKI